MSNELRISLIAVPSHPRAGEWFHLVVGLVDGGSKTKLTVTFEKHRLAVDSSGTHELCPIQMNYFEDGSLNPIELMPGDRVGYTKVKVLANAANPPCPPNPPDSESVEFPDRLLFTAFVTDNPGDEPLTKEHTGVTIWKP